MTNATLTKEKKTFIVEDITMINRDGDDCYVEFTVKDEPNYIYYGTLVRKENGWHFITIMKANEDLLSNRFAYSTLEQKQAITNVVLSHHKLRVRLMF